MQLTMALVYAAAHDAGTRNMRRHGRTEWNLEDWQAACDEFNRLIVLL